MLILFACKTIPFDDLLTCSYGLTRTERTVFKALLSERGPRDVLFIARKVGLERSGVQKALNRLLEKGLVTREKGLNKRGGLIYRYQTKPLHAIQEEITTLIRQWCRKAEATVIQELERIHKTGAHASTSS